jgi:hypothetical protein
VGFQTILTQSTSNEAHLWDLMSLEAETVPCVVVHECDTAIVHDPIMETVTFLAGSASPSPSSQDGHRATPPPWENTTLVTTAGGSSSSQEAEGSKPPSPQSFVQAISKMLPPSALSTPPIYCRPQPRPCLMKAPRRSTRLAKKARQRPPAVVAAQNVLMKKLSLVTKSHIESDNFDRYIKLFNESIIEDQARKIEELLMHHIP